MSTPPPRLANLITLPKTCRKQLSVQGARDRDFSCTCGGRLSSYSAGIVFAFPAAQSHFRNDVCGKGYALASRHTVPSTMRWWLWQNGGGGGGCGGSCGGRERHGGCEEEVGAGTGAAGLPAMVLAGDAGDT